jgi:predicted transcriptional regulator
MEVRMVTLTLKGIPDELYEKLKEVAKANNRSINGEVLFAIKRALLTQPINVEATLERARVLREATAHYVATDEELTRFKNEGRE